MAKAKEKASKAPRAKAAKAARTSGAPSLANALYEAARPSRLRRIHREGMGPNNLVSQGAVPLRGISRYLERNNDLCRGIVRTLVNNVVGPGGIGIEPQPRRADGTIHEEYAAQLRHHFKDWCKRPEVTWKHSWAQAQRLGARTWFRDGEFFAQKLLGNVPYLDHGTRVPFSLELFEPDLVPMDYNDVGQGIRQGIQTNAWGRMTGAWVYKQHPLESAGILSAQDLKFIPADRLLHVFRPDRLHQLRGVSEFAAVLNRLQDLGEYEGAEQIAAKMAASLTLYIKRGNPDLYDPEADGRSRDDQGQPIPREIEFEPGTIIDSLGIGEDIGLIDSKRPNPNALAWRLGQLRAIASGVGASYSSISRDYDGSYSAQRQELVEQFVHYAVLTDDFTSLFVAPTWESFVIAADLSRVVPIPRDVVPETVSEALYIGQSMPWIDPGKEAVAWLTLVRAGFASEVEVMRRRGVNPMDVLEQVAQWRNKVAEKGLHFDSDAAMEQAITQALQQDSAGANPTNRSRARTRATAH